MGFSITFDIFTQLYVMLVTLIPTDQYIFLNILLKLNLMDLQVQ